MVKKPGIHNFYIKPADLEQLRGAGDWRLRDITPSQAANIRPFMAGIDVVAVMASGTCAPPTGGMVGGFEVIRLESRPKPEEPPLNIYHYEIGAATTVAGEQVYPVWGPFETGGPGVEHWAEYDALEVYVKRMEDELKAGCAMPVAADATAEARATGQSKTQAKWT